MYFITLVKSLAWNVLWISQSLLLCYIQKLIVKPDQLIKRRGKLGLIKLNVDLNGVKEWVSNNATKEIVVGTTTGILKHFIVEPFIPHEQVTSSICMFSSTPRRKKLEEMSFPKVSVGVFILWWCIACNPCCCRNVCQSYENTHSVCFPSKVKEISIVCSGCVTLPRTLMQSLHFSSDSINQYHMWNFTSSKIYPL